MGWVPKAEAEEGLVTIIPQITAHKECLVPQATFSSKDFADPKLCKGLLRALRDELDGPLRFMEVCGSHTVAIFRSGLRSLLPEGITHLSGPGCPVCVTHDSEIAAFLTLAAKENVTIATFGDLMRVPGPKGMSLANVNKVHDALVVAFNDPAVKETIARQVNTIAINTPEQAQAAFRRELAKYAALVKKAGIELQ